MRHTGARLPAANVLAGWTVATQSGALRSVSTRTAESPRSRPRIPRRSGRTRSGPSARWSGAPCAPTRGAGPRRRRRAGGRRHRPSGRRGGSSARCRRAETREWGRIRRGCRAPAAGAERVHHAADSCIVLVHERRMVAAVASWRSTSWTRSPKMNRLSAPTASAISILAPSSVPIVSAPFSANFMLPVPDASVPAVEICSDRSAAGVIVSASETR